MTLFKRKPKKKIVKPAVAVQPKQSEADTMAAIAAAMYLYYREIHDFENYVITFKRIEKIYSPWSSKIYGLRKTPR